MVFEEVKLQQQQEQGNDNNVSSEAGKNSSEPEPLNVRILHSLEETISSSVQAVKDAVIGADVEDLKQQNDEQVSNNGVELKKQKHEVEDGSRSLLQSVEETIVSSVHSVEETIAQSVQTVKEAVNAAAEAAAAPVAGGERPDEKMATDPAVVDEAAILVHSVQD